MPTQHSTMTVGEFLQETSEDLKSPTTSTFGLRIPDCKDAVSVLEQVSISLM